MIRGFIQGIINLFKSGIILHPMVLLGVIVGISSAKIMGYEDVLRLYANIKFYIGSLLISFVYVFVFKRIYKIGGSALDYSEMGLAIIGNALKFIVSSFLAISFFLVMFF